ncbi:MAG: antitoxin [Gammaproteobacteria bacterium]|nr:antitoxin [Gammaproteobacteria bacterium]MYD00717.1 antitoxin [Gammaproteobacteria bacterium]MYI25495.1 antitoxin [Gammaproteobacteria bacterium]
MRSTVRIDDDLMTTVKTRARGEGVSMTRMLNRLVRLGLEALSREADKPRPYREKTFRMGRPQVNLDKALALVASLEDEETLRKMSLRK